MTTTPVSQSGVYTNTYTDLPISKEATTSRVLVNNDVLRHVMFTMDAGQVLTEHTSTRAVIINTRSRPSNPPACPSHSSWCRRGDTKNECWCVEGTSITTKT